MPLSQLLINIALGLFGSSLVIFLAKPKAKQSNQKFLTAAWWLFSAGSAALLVSVLTHTMSSTKLQLALACSVIALFARVQTKMLTAGPMISPIILILLLVEVFSTPHFPNWRPTSFSAIVLDSHITMAVLGQACAIFAFIVSALFLIQDRALKKKKLTQLISDVPSLDRLERILMTFVWIGFGMLSLSLLTGALYTQLYIDASASSLDAKLGWAILIWLWYLGVLLQRNVFNRPIKSTAIMSLIGFALLVIGFFGLVFQPVGGA